MGGSIVADLCRYVDRDLGALVVHSKPFFRQRWHGLELSHFTFDRTHTSQALAALSVALLGLEPSLEAFLA